MKKHFILATSLVAFTLTSFDYAVANSSSVEVVENRPVSHIEISIENLPPSSSFDPKAILTRMKTKVGDPFSQSVFDTDLKMLADEYDRVEPSIEETNGEVYIHIRLWPRPVIRSLLWEGNDSMKTKKLQKELGIHEGSVFNRESFNKGLNKVKEHYIKKGFFESQIDYRSSYDPKTNEIDIIIEVHEGRSGKIEDIDFNGFTSEERSALLNMIYTKRYNLFTSWLTGHGIYNEDALEQDNLTIVNFLQNEGFADAKVKIQILEGSKPGKIIIKISADKGEIYHFGKISFNGNTVFTDKEIEAVFIARPDGTYSPDSLRNTAQAITDHYGRKGYIDTNVQYETDLVEDKPIYNVHFTIEEGGQFRVGLIHIIGNVNTQDKVILRESNLIPGEIFDTAKLKATQARLENMGYFKSVNVYAVRTTEDEAMGENFRDVYIEVKEGMTGNVSLFFGFSTSDNVFAGLDLGENNFNIRGVPYIFRDGLSALRGGGEYAHAKLNFGKRQRSYSLSWMDPYFQDSLWRFGVELMKANSRMASTHYDITTYGATVYASYPLSAYWTYGTKYRVRNETTKVQKHRSPEEEEMNKRGIVSAVSTSITYDSTLTLGKPRRGLRSYTEVEFAGLGGPFTFLKFSYTNAYYSSLWKKGIMKYRYDFRFIEPLWKTKTAHDIPLSERFFLGGETSVRGYTPFDLGPHFSGGDPTGGISSVLFSVEYLQEIFSFLDAFVFADAGKISLHRFSIGPFNEIRMSCGYGIRLQMLGQIPIILGMGYPINPHEDSEVRRFFFSMGGQF